MAETKHISPEEAHFKMPRSAEELEQLQCNYADFMAVLKSGNVVVLDELPVVEEEPLAPVIPLFPKQ